MARMRGRYFAAFLLCLLSIAGARHETADAQAGATLTILHINDVYEIDAIDGAPAASAAIASPAAPRACEGAGADDIGRRLSFSVGYRHGDHRR